MLKKKGLKLKLKDKTDGKNHRREHSDLISRGFPESWQAFRAKGIHSNPGAAILAIVKD